MAVSLPFSLKSPSFPPSLSCPSHSAISSRASVSLRNVTFHAAQSMSFCLSLCLSFSLFLYHSLPYSYLIDGHLAQVSIGSYCTLSHSNINPHFFPLISLHEVSANWYLLTSKQMTASPVYTCTAGNKLSILTLLCGCLS